MKRIMLLLLTVALIISITGFTQTAEAATIKLNKTSLTLVEGKSYTLKLSGTKSKISWTSSNKDIVTVSNKGIVSAKSEGSASIIATANKKKYQCKITVKPAFNASEAQKKFDQELIRTGNDIILMLTNNYSYPLSLEATAVFYDDNGNMISKSTDDNYYFEKGQSCVLKFAGPYDSDYKPIVFGSCGIVYSIKPVSESYTSNVKDITTKDNIGADNVMIEVTNNGSKSSMFTSIGIVFYKNGKAIYSESKYADVKDAGSKDYLEFRFPSDDEYNTIIPDDYKIFVNYSYN